MEMEMAGRHVILLSDNCPSHMKFNQEDYPNVRVVFFPPKMTPHLQPMDAGIIRAFKAIYKRLRILKIFLRDNAGETDPYYLSQLDAMHMAVEAWSQITRTTIRNCWKHTGILGGAKTDKTDTIPIDPTLLTAEDQGKTAVSELDKALKKLNLKHVAKGDAMTAVEWLDMPDENVTEGVWTDEDVIQQVEINKREANGEHIAELDVDSRESESKSALVSPEEALSALEKLNQYLKENPSHQSDRHQTFNRHLQANIRLEQTSEMSQSRLHSFFEPKAR